MPIINPDPIEIRRIEAAIRRLPTEIGNHARNFFLAGWQKQGWQSGTGLIPWQPRKDTKNDRPLLVFTGNLRRSLTKEVNGPYIAVKVTGQAARYADAQNFGFKGPVTVQGKNKVFTRMMDIPQRQFIGQTKALDREIQALVDRRLLDALK